MADERQRRIIEADLGARAAAGDGEQQAGIVLRRVTDLATEAGILWGVHGRHCIAPEAGLRPGRPTAEPLRGGCVGWSRKAVSRLGRVGRRVGGRRKPIPGGLAAASMPRTPRKPTVPRLRQFPAAVGFPLLLVGVDLGRHTEHGNDRNRLL
ncbi:hypothetical protein G6F68_013147 [Rhizopus microsporus]|nr:hypothetical protein G6F68_013147 [Rhizopus microsporus]